MLLTKFSCWPASLGEDAHPEVTRLGEVVLGQLTLMVNNMTTPGLITARRILTDILAVSEVQRVVGWSSSKIIVVVSTITMQRVEAVLGTIDRKLVEIGTKTITLSILVCKCSDLKNCQIS